MRLVAASECLLEATNKLACFYRRYSMNSNLVNDTCVYVVMLVLFFTQILLLQHLQT